MMRRGLKSPEKIADNVGLVLAPKHKQDIVDKLYRERLDQAYALTEPQDEKKRGAGVTVVASVRRRRVRGDACDAPQSRVTRVGCVMCGS